MAHTFRTRTSTHACTYMLVELAHFYPLLVFYWLVILPSAARSEAKEEGPGVVLQRRHLGHATGRCLSRLDASIANIQEGIIDAVFSFVCVFERVCILAQRDEHVRLWIDWHGMHLINFSLFRTASTLRFLHTWQEVLEVEAARRHQGCERRQGEGCLLIRSLFFTDIKKPCNGSCDVIYITSDVSIVCFFSTFLRNF